jgi:hypothetical protein
VIEDFDPARARGGLRRRPDAFVFRIGNPGSCSTLVRLDGDGVPDRIHLSAAALGYPEADAIIPRWS